MRSLNRPMFRMGGPIKEGVMHGIREPRKSGGRTGFVNAGEVYKNVEKLYTPPVKKKSGIVNTKKGYQFTETPASKALTGFTHYGPYSAMAALYDVGAVPINTLSRIFGYNPGFSGTKFMDTLTGGAYSKRTGYDPDKAYFIAPTSAKKGWTIPSMQEENLKKDDKSSDLPSVKKVLTDAEKKLIEDAKLKNAKADRDKRVNNLLEIMGYDKSRKNAAYDALIDASEVIRETGFKDKSILPIVKATSARFDKPEQIREAVGLMMAKGEIEKDIAQTKGGPLDQQVESLKKNLKMDTATATRVAKGLPKDLREQVTVDIGTTRQPLTHTTLKSSVRKWYPEAIVLMNADEAKKTLDKNQSAEDYLSIKMTEKLEKDPNAKVEGIYIIDKEVVKIDGAGNTSTVFP